MAYPIKVCEICSEEFELKPDKPGLATRCPEHSPRRALTIKEAQEAHKEERHQAIESGFRDAISAKQSAKAQGDKAAASQYQDEIVRIDKTRRRPWLSK
jgi:flagellar biosynthesis/type III secretory pathway protein FliH